MMFRSGTMRARRTVRAERVQSTLEPVPRPATGAALDRVNGVTSCGSDLHIWESDSPTDLPIVHGNENAGLIANSDDATPWANSPQRNGSCSYP